MKTEKKTVYRCELCGTSYKKKEDAEACEAAGRLIEEYKKLPKYCVLRVIPKRKDLAPKLVPVRSYCQWNSCAGSPCIKQTWDAFDLFCLVDKFYSLGKTYTVERVLTFEEAYAEYGYIPATHVSKDWDRVPESVRNRIFALYDLERKRIMSELEATPKETLVAAEYLNRTRDFPPVSIDW